MKSINELKRDLEREGDVYCLLEDVAPREGIPGIPEEYKEKLEEAYLRYEHFIGINCGEFSPMEIEEERQKYPHLLFLGENGLPMFDEQKCREYMHVISGVAKIYCVAYIYEENLELVASNILTGNPLEHLQEFYYETLQLIKNIEE